MKLSRTGIVALTLVSALVLMAACSDGGADDRPRAIGQTREAIVGGSLDTTHSATVSLLLSGGGSQVGRCSGTIVRVDSAGKGTVLTSAHCFELSPTTVKIATGPDFDAPVAQFTATKWTLYPVSGGAIFEKYHDLALVEFEGATGLPVMPLVKPADYVSYTTSSAFTIVGYGRVSIDASVTSSVRKKLAVTFSNFQETWLLDKGPFGSTCFGDSGGTVIDASSGTERLAAVTQGGNCAGANDFNSAVAFYAPEISQWLRDNGFDMPAAPTLPNGADCTLDASCHSGACLHFSVSPSVFLDLCGDKLKNDFACERSAQCESNLCGPGGGCIACAKKSDCGSGECTGGKCVAPTPVDAGTDAGADAGTDAGAGVTDASAPADASGSSSSSSSSSSSGSAPPPGATSSTSSTSGGADAAPVTAPAEEEESGCSTSGSSSRGSSALLLLALAVLLRRRR